MLCNPEVSRNINPLSVIPIIGVNRELRARDNLEQLKPTLESSSSPAICAYWVEKQPAQLAPEAVR